MTLPAIQSGRDLVVHQARSIPERCDGRLQSTTTCRVPPSFPVVESWGDPMVSLELQSFELLPWVGDPRTRAAVCD
jgi:hypothetical protein